MSWLKNIFKKIDRNVIIYGETKTGHTFPSYEKYLEYKTKQNSNILIEINEILLKLIKVGKLDLMVSKSINEFGNNNDMSNINTKDIEFEIENV